jgi:hypothetical protein
MTFDFIVLDGRAGRSFAPHDLIFQLWLIPNDARDVLQGSDRRLADLTER